MISYKNEGFSLKYEIKFFLVTFKTVEIIILTQLFAMNIETINIRHKEDVYIDDAIIYDFAKNCISPNSGVVYSLYHFPTGK